MQKKTKFSHLVLAGVGACAILVTPTAFAKDRDDIVVTAPYSVQQNRDGREVTVSRIVSTSGLDLRRDRDVERLHQRIAEAADIACEQADDVLPNNSPLLSGTSDRECVRNAIRGATPKMHAVVSAARA